MVRWSVPGVVHPREAREDPMGRRVVARHRFTRRSLAITYLSPELLADTEFRTRFARDFPRLTRVRETRVARVHRYLECEHGAAVIGDHVRGTSLRALLLAHGAVGTAAALVMFKDSLLALAACHDAGLAHGDIKPEDVILTPAGLVRLVDFGLWTSDGRRSLARSTPFYLAPEQWSDRPTVQAGDVYAATVTFFESLAGAPPFYADSAAELSAKHEHGTPQVDVVPEPVRELVLRGLAKDPRSRPDARCLLADVGEVAARAVGSNWELRGRRELAALVANRSALPDAFVSPRQGGGWGHCKPVRLAAVMGGALALAAGLSSPPLAVIMPGSGIFSSFGRSPVLAFPEPDRDTKPLRVVTNGLLADRVLSPAAKTGTAGPVAGTRPPAPSPTTVPRIQTAPAASDGLQQGSIHRDGTAYSRSAPDKSTPAPPACTQQRMSDHQPCTAVNPEQPFSGSVGTTSDPSQVSIPVSLPVPVEAPVQLPVSVKLPVSVQLPSIIPIQKSQPRKDMTHPKETQVSVDFQRRGKAGTAQKHASVKVYEQPTNYPQRNSGYSESRRPGNG
jgi:hypothetical protein